MRRSSLSLLFLASLATSAVLPAQNTPDDPFIWLEEVDSKRSLDWVNARNERTFAELGTTPLYKSLYDRTLAILNSSDRIAYPRIIGDQLYNFWQDATHKRGIWRRTTWNSYLSGNPVWETVIDLDALSAAENTTFSWGGASCFDPEERLCIVSLSKGGSDASEGREFDLRTKQFVANGFRLPAAKKSTAWVDANTLLVGTDFGPGTMTSSGYARTIRLWKRGTPLSSATIVYEAPAENMGAFVGVTDAGSRRFIEVQDWKTFYTSTKSIYRDGRLVKVDVPADADLYLVGDQMVVYVRDPWTVAGKTWATGSLVSTPVDDFLAGKRDLRLVTLPGPRETINGISATKDYLLLNVLNNVRGELRKYRYTNGAWSFEKVQAPDLGAVGVVETSPRSNRFFYTYTNFIQPTTLYLSDEQGKIAEVKRLPAQFNAEGLHVEQMEATSKDGTKIPFFIVHKQGMAHDGNNPTLLYAYGGFESSSLPNYGATVGANWLERGGVYVLANIRGGGEFGPAWHRAGLKENRQRVYDDFIAVAEELIRHKVTSPRRLGIMGGSNGGLLVGVALTQRPELFNAVVIQVPLLDMQRYSQLLAGASWMAEYGDPSKPEEWAYISRYSPYQNLRAGTKYPKVLFTTTTRDDRVHPGHARKMAARMESMGIPFYYFENTEGGHGSGVTNEQRAKTLAITYAYLWHQLGPGN